MSESTQDRDSVADGQERRQGDPPSDSLGMQRLMEWLRGSRFCDGVNDDVISEIARCTQLRTIQAGEILASAGEPVTHLTILVEGAIQAKYLDVKGREHILGCMSAGDHAGDMSLLANSPHAASLIATSSGTVLEIPAEHFHRLVDQHPRLLRNLFNTLGGQVREFAGVAKRRPVSSVLAVVGATGNVLTLTRRLVNRLAERGERVCIWAKEPRHVRLGDNLPPVRRIGSDGSEEIRRYRKEHPNAPNRHIVIAWSESWSNVGPHDVVAADQVFWVLDATNCEAARRRWDEIASQVPNFAKRARRVWLLDSRTPVSPWTDNWKPQLADVRIPLGADESISTIPERHGIDRLVRALCGYSFGLALAGGGARGMAHLGVLKAFDEAGIGFDMISGTSCGAMVGIVYAAGIEPDWAVQQFARELTPPQEYQHLPGGAQWFLLAQYRRRAWDRMLRKYLHDWRLEQLMVPAMATAVDLVTARDIVRDRGDAVHAILESINLPGIAQPIMRDGMALVDGGILNNLPADVLVERGADFVVGVDVTSRLRQEFAGLTTGSVSKPKRAGTIETLFRVFETQAYGLGDARNRAVDFWITPDTGAFDFTDFTRARSLADAGAAAANEALPRLRSQLEEFERRVLSPLSP